MIKKRQELIKKYIEFFKKKGHKEIPNSSLIPQNDPTVLFTTAGMHPIVLYILGEKHPLGKRLVNVQKCIRTGDIREVGDDFHLTFFEMLGNWSLGDYFKKEAIEYSHEFLTKILKIPSAKIFITCFAGDKNSPKDMESSDIWKKLGITKVKFFGKEDNWWGPAGTTGPCGPDTEMFVNNCEIWNDVFMKYNKDKRLILVDGMHCIYDENFNLNKELLEIVNSFNAHTVLTVNGFREKGLSLVKSYKPSRDTNWEAFSLEEKKIKKDSLVYFKELIKRFKLKPEEIIYFDHDKKNIETAKKIGILSEHYTDIKSIKKFIEDNLFAFISLKQKNVDTGMGVERTLAVLNNCKSVYETTTFQPIIKEIEKISKQKNLANNKSARIVADHIKASVFILTDGIAPSNVERGYVLRRLIRRAVRYGKLLGIKENFTAKLVNSVIKIYPDYKEIKQNKNYIIIELDKEESRFRQTLESGMREFEKMTKNMKKGSQITGKEAFLLYQSYGFPYEMTEELANEKSIRIDKTSFQKEEERHQKLSRTASAGQFKSGLADNSEKTKKLHTAAHLLDEALRKVLKDEGIKQKGSNITPERLRFDFNFPRKLEEKEIKELEKWINEKIKKKIPVKREEMTFQKAVESGAGYLSQAKYPKIVSVYTIGEGKNIISREICTGPHASNTKELGKLKITKEEGSSAGIRRIKAILE